MKVNILGTDYIIKKQKAEDNPKLENANGLCETYSKEIILEEFIKDKMMLNNIEGYEKSVLRHEIIHAFLHESGLDGSSTDRWARNEEMIDYFALQIEKMMSVMESAGCAGESSKMHGCKDNHIE